MTGTLPPGMIDLLAGQASIDPDAGLVYLGNGRYFDPVLGLPLQPNPLGGIPTVPQSLNRYAAGSLGQPGVAEGVINGGYNLLPDAFGIIKGYLLDKASLSPVVAGYKYIGQAEITIQASRSALARKIPDALRDAFVDLRPVGKTSMYRKTGLLLLGGSTEQELGTAAKQIETTLIEALPSRGSWKASVLVSEVSVLDRLPQYVKLGEISSFKSLKFGLGPALDVAVGGYVQYLSDKDNPYLTGGQKLSRSLVSGGGSAITAYGVGVGLSYLGCASTVYCGIVAGVIGVGVWMIGQPLIFDNVPFFKPADRNLAPLRDN